MDYSSILLWLMIGTLAVFSISMSLEHLFTIPDRLSEIADSIEILPEVKPSHND